MGIVGIKVIEGKIHFGSGNSCLELNYDRDELRKILVSLRGYESFPNSYVKKTKEQQIFEDTIAKEVEKKWREDKQYIQTTNEQEILGVKYIGTMQGYHVYAHFVHPAILQLEFTGNSCYCTNIFVTSGFGLSRESFMSKVIEYIESVLSEK